LVAVASFIPGRAKDLSPPRHTPCLYFTAYCFYAANLYSMLLYGIL